MEPGISSSFLRPGAEGSSTNLEFWERVEEGGGGGRGEGVNCEIHRHKRKGMVVLVKED
jgi:hypothetical protein